MNSLESPYFMDNDCRQAFSEHSMQYVVRTSSDTRTKSICSLFIGWET